MQYMQNIYFTRDCCPSKARASNFKVAKWRWTGKDWYNYEVSTVQYFLFYWKQFVWFHRILHNQYSFHFYLTALHIGYSWTSSIKFNELFFSWTRILFAQNFRCYTFDLNNFYFVFAWHTFLSRLFFQHIILWFRNSTKFTQFLLFL